MSENKSEKKMQIIIPKSRTKKSQKCETTEQAYTIFNEVLNYEKYELKDQEHLWIMGIDLENYVSCIYIAAIGAENRVIIAPSDMFATAINHKSRKVILAHNHPNPNGNFSLSMPDLDLTNRLYHACLPFDIEIIDHIILFDKGYYSFLKDRFMAIIHASPKYKPYNQVKEKLDEEKEKEKKQAEKMGILKGLDEGEAMGKKEGEHNKAVEMAKKMLLKNKPLEEIIEFTGLNEEEIEKLK